MENKPLLSICIPTYNREKYLRECLDSIINQDGFNEEDVEIVISDNASSDNTTQLVQDYQKNHSNIKYIRNTENIGADRNIIATLQLGDGDYIWGLSDDDIVLTGGLKKIVQNLRKNNNKNIGLFQVNFNVLNQDIKIYDIEGYLGKKLKTKTYDNLGSLYKSYGYIHNGLSFFSINIFSSDIHDFKLNEIPVTQYPHSCVAGLLSHRKARFIGYNAIGFRQHNSSIENISKVSTFFKIFVIDFMKYMKFMRQKKSSVSQYRLCIILIKMIIYSCWLKFKTFF